MADLPISGLPSAGALSGTEPLAIVQSGATKQTTVQDVANLAGGSLTSDELDAIQGSSLPSSSNVFITDSAQTFTKDANYNVFYNGVTPTLGTGSSENIFYRNTNNCILGNSCAQNTFYQSANYITLGNFCLGNTFEQLTRDIIFGDNLRQTLVRSANYGNLDLTASPTFNFLYSRDYNSEIYIGLDLQPYHRYYDGANNRDVITLLVSPYTVSYIGGGSSVTDFTDLGDVPSSYTGQANKIVSVKNDESGLEFTTASGGGDAYLANDQTFTGENTFTIASGNDTPVTINKGGSNAALIVNKTSGSGDAIEVAQGSLSIDDETASTIAHFDSNKRIKSLATSTYPSLTELALVKGVTSDIQTQLNAKLNLVRASNLIDIATDGAATSGTSNTYSTGGLITPSQISAGDAIEIYTIVRKSAGNGTVTIRLYANTTNDLSGSPILIGASAAIAAATRQTYFTRWLRIKATSGSSTEVLSTTLTTQTDSTNATTLPSTLSIDWTVNQYLIVAIQNSNGSDSSVSTMFKVRR